MFHNASEVDVIAGKYTYVIKGTGDDVRGEQRASVSAVITHPGYNDTDIAKRTTFSVQLGEVGGGGGGGGVARFCPVFFSVTVVKVSVSRAEDPGFESRLRRDFSRLSHTSDLKLAHQWLPCQARCQYTVTG